MDKPKKDKEEQRKSEQAKSNPVIEKKDGEQGDDYKNYVHPSAHGYLNRESGLIQDVQENEAGTFDTSELEGDDAPEK